jgi:ABC-type transporter Mla subunit MlaD
MAEKRGSKTIKNVIIMKALKLSLFFSILVSIFGSCLNKGDYNLHLIIDKVCNVNAGSKVLLEGKEIGRVEEVTVIDTNMVIVNLRIYNGVRIPKINDVKCTENILGDTFIKVSFGANEPVDKSGYLRDKDTLYGKYTSEFKKLDSTSTQEIFNKLNDLKNTVDSIIEKKDSVISK